MSILKLTVWLYFYSEYVDLLSPDKDYSPSPPPFSNFNFYTVGKVSSCTVGVRNAQHNINTDFLNSSGMSVAGLIQKHQASVLRHDNTDSCQLRVGRKHLLEDTLRKFRSGLALDKPLWGTFLGEPGVDEGAGFQSYFVQNLQCISNVFLVIT